jgi:hypothetical protein
MRRSLIAIAVAGVIATTAAIALAVVGPPEVDKANAVFRLTTKVAPVGCAGEDATQYATWRSIWKGSETEATPGSTDYVLTGKLAYNAAVTVNMSTHRGVMRGTVTLTVPSTAGTPGVKVYSGPLTIVVQGVDTPNGFVYNGRGFLEAFTYSKDPASGKLVRDGGQILANVEVKFPTSAAGGAFDTMSGQFGDAGALPAEPVVPDYSVASNNLTCA